MYLLFILGRVSGVQKVHSENIIIRKQDWPTKILSRYAYYYEYYAYTRLE